MAVTFGRIGQDALGIKNPRYISDNIKIQTMLGNTIVLPSSRYRPQQFQRYIPQTNTQTQSYVVDYNDPYALNSFADAILNQEAKRRRYGDVLGSNWLNVINTPLAVLDVLYNTTVAPIAAGIKGEDISFGEGLSSAGLNLLMNFGESLDILANPIKGMVIEGYDAAKNNENVWNAIGHGLVNGLGQGSEGRKNYDYDTGNVVSDIALELVSDPFNWFSFGASTALKGTAKTAGAAVAKTAAKELGEETAQEVAEKFGKQFSKNLVNSLRGSKLNAELVNQALQDSVKPNMMKAILRKAGDTSDEAVEALSKKLLENITDDTTQMVLESLDKVKVAAAIYRGGETVESFLRQGVMWTSPLIATKPFTLGYKALNTMLNKKLAKEGITSLADYLVKHNVLDESLTAVSEGTKKDLDQQVVNYFVKQEIQILNNVRDVHTKIKNIFSAICMPLENTQRMVITDFAPFNRALAELEELKGTLDAMFSTHAGMVITDFNSYKAYIDASVKEGFIPKQYAEAVAQLDNVLKHADSLKADLQKILAPVDLGYTVGMPTRETLELYKTFVTDLHHVFELKDVGEINVNGRIIKRFSKELLDEPSVVKNQLRTYIDNVDKRCDELIQQHPEDVNPLLMALKNRIQVLKETVKGTADERRILEMRRDTVRTIAEDPTPQLKSARTRLRVLKKSEIPELKSKIKTTLEVLKTPQSLAAEQQSTRGLKILNIQLAFKERDVSFYTDLVELLEKRQALFIKESEEYASIVEALEKIDKKVAAALDNLITEAVSNYNNFFRNEDAFMKLYEKLDKIRVDKLLADTKPTTKGGAKRAARLADNAKKNIEKVLEGSYSEITLKHKDDSAQLLANAAVTRKTAEQIATEADDLDTLKTIMSFHDTVVSAQEFLDPVAFRNLCYFFDNYVGLLKAHTSQSEGLLALTRAGRLTNYEALQEQFERVVRESQEVLKDIPTRVEQINKGLAAYRGGAGSVASREKLLKGLQKLINGNATTARNTYTELYDVLERLSKESLDEAASSESVLKVLFNELPEPTINIAHLQLVTDVEQAIKQQTVLYQVQADKAGVQKALYELPALHQLAEEVYTGTGLGGALKELAQRSAYTNELSPLVNQLMAYYDFTHYYLNIFEHPALADLDPALKWGWLDSISGTHSISPEVLLDEIEWRLKHFEEDALQNASMRPRHYKGHKLESDAKDFIDKKIKALSKSTDERDIALRNRLIELNDAGAHDAFDDCKRTAALYLANEDIQKQIVINNDEICIVLDFETSGTNAKIDAIHQIGLYGLDGSFSADIKAYATRDLDDDTLRALYKNDVAEGKSIEEIREKFYNTYRAADVPSEKEALVDMLQRLKTLQETTGKRVVLLAHNGEKFDYTLLSNRLKHLEVSKELRAFFETLRKEDTLFAWRKADGAALFSPKHLETLEDLTTAYASSLSEHGATTFAELANGYLATALRNLAADIVNGRVLRADKALVPALQDAAEAITRTLDGAKPKLNKVLIPFDKGTNPTPIMHLLYKNTEGPTGFGLKRVVDYGLMNRYFTITSADTVEEHMLLTGYARTVDNIRKSISSTKLIERFTSAELEKAYHTLLSHPECPAILRARFKPAKDPVTLYAQLRQLAQLIQHNTSDTRTSEEFFEDTLTDLFSTVFEPSEKEAYTALAQDLVHRGVSFDARYGLTDLDLNTDVVSDAYNNKTQTYLQELEESLNLNHSNSALGTAAVGLSDNIRDLKEFKKIWQTEYVDKLPEPGRLPSKHIVGLDLELRGGAKRFGMRSLERLHEQTADEFYQELYLSAGRKVVSIAHGEPPLSESFIKELKAKGVFVSEPIKKDNGILYYICADYDMLPKTALPKFEEIEDLIPSSVPLNEFVKNGRRELAKYMPDIGCTTGDRLTVKAVEDFDTGFFRDIVSQTPEAARFLTSVNDLNKIGFFTERIRANHLIVGGPWAKATLAPMDDMVYDTSNNIVKKTLNNLAHCYADENRLINFLGMYFNKDMSLNEGLLWKYMSDDVIYNLMKNNKDIVCVVLVKSKHTKTGFEVKTMKLVNAKSVKYARQAGAVILPRAQYATLANKVNKWTLNPVFKILSARSYTYKAGYLASLGTVFRNVFSGVLNNYFTMDQPAGLPKTVKHWIQSCQDYIKYLDIIKDNADELSTIFRIKNIDVQTARLTELFKTKSITSMDVAYFKEMHTFMQHQASGGLSEELIRAMETITKEADKDPLDAALKQYSNMLYKIPHIKLLQNANGIVEHALRWSLYTMQIQNGATINEALSAVIRTHFDYSDKTYAQYILEFFVPFMSFSMKNLEYYANLIEECGWVLPVLRDMMTPIWDFDTLTAADEQLYESYDRTMSAEDYRNLKPSAPWTSIQSARLYHMLSGNILLPLDRTAYKTYEDYNGALKQELKNVYQVFKINPAFMDAVNLVTNPVDAVTNRLLPPYEHLGSWLWALANGEQYFKPSMLNDLPIVGPMLQRYAITGLNDPTVKSVIDKVEDSGNVMNAVLPSLFSTAYLNPTRIEDVKTPEQLERFLYRQKYLYEKFGVDTADRVAKIYTNMYRNKMYPRKMPARKTHAWKQATSYRTATRRYQTYHTSQRSIDRHARNDIYKDLYTTSGYSRMALNLGPTTSKNLKYRIAAIKNMYRYK